jgi:hypothetical protein
MVRGHYAADERLGGESNPEYAAEFDRWLEEVLNAARAEAWEDGYRCGEMDANCDGDDWLDPFDNPYREGAD